MAENYANGGDPGLIRGPGTGISDSIPAHHTDTGRQLNVSNGEYIVPEDVVKAKGVEFFDKLLAKYHMPAEEQRRRYGIGGKHG